MAKPSNSDQAAVVYLLDLRMIDGSGHFDTSGDLARRGEKAMRASFSIWRLLARFGGPFVLSAWVFGVMFAPSWAGSGPTADRSRIVEGARLFLTDWSTVNRDGMGGDGLGPVFNERSCVACHNQGGPGGSGGSRFDVMVLTDSSSPRLRDGTIDPPKPDNPQAPAQPLPSAILPGFAAGPSLVFHRFSNDKDHERWRSRTLGSLGLAERGSPNPGGCRFNVRASYRNTPALFGAGLIDAIPESAIEEAARREHPAFPQIKGRPAYGEDGRIGRFGWKGQMASLDDFVRTACANELGLENPGHAQPCDPRRPGYKAPGVDLTEAECASLTAYVASLPRPVEPRRPSLLRGEQIDRGRLIFDSIGCSTCHLPKLGDVSGLYADLLLHDLGQELSDTGSSYGQATSPGLAFDTPKAAEWRTPPLWGLRDSAPYLHDGRATTISSAITLHGGQASPSVGLYRQLDGEQKGYLKEFLLSLAAPPQADGPRKSRHR